MEYSHLLTILRLSLKESHLATFFFVMLSPGKLLTLPATVLHLYSTECWKYHWNSFLFTTTLYNKDLLLALLVKGAICYVLSFPNGNRSSYT